MATSDRRWAVVTGASAGLGAALARALACGVRGIDVGGVVLVARRKARLDALAEEISAMAEARGRPFQVLAVEADLSDAAAGVAAVVSATRGLEVDVLVNNAGLSVGCCDFDKTSTSGIDGELNVNVRSPMLLTRAILPGMVERGRGHVLNIASIASFLPAPFMATYGASKAWLYCWTVALTRELASTPVSATCYCPGHLQTEFDSAAGSSERLLCSLPGMSEPDLDRVARHALWCTAKRKRWATNGWVNWLAIMTAGVVPLGALLALVAAIQRIPGCRA